MNLLGIGVVLELSIVLIVVDDFHVTVTSICFDDTIMVWVG